MDNYSILDWDSKFFGYKVCSIRPKAMPGEYLGRIVSDLRSLNVKLIYCFVEPDDRISTDAIESLSGFHADSKVTYIKSLPERLDFEKPDSIIPYEGQTPSGDLIQLALESGIYSRFRVDPNFKNNEFERLYTEWIVKSVKGEISDVVFVYRDENGAVKGFVTLKVSGNTGTIGLIAVDETVRGRSIGKKLMSTVLFYLCDKGIKTAEVATQKANSQACRFYETLGFEVKNIINVYHLWIS